MTPTRRLRTLAIRFWHQCVRWRTDGDVATELESHLQFHIDDNIRAGMSPEEARRSALVQLGGIVQTTERLRDQRGIPFLETTVNDMRYAFRSLRRNPTFAFVAIATLALGIGANTAIFSVVDGVLLRPAPFADLDRLMMVWETDRKSGTTREPSAIPDYVDFQRRTKSFAQLAAIAPTEVNLTTNRSEPRRLAALLVAHEFFPLVGLSPSEGRVFSVDEDRRGASQVAIVSQELAAELFGPQGSIVGNRVRLDDVDRTIVGVMPPGADFGTLQLLGAADYSRGFAERGGRVKVDVWLPLAPDPRASRDNHPLFVMGRLAPSAPMAAAQQEMTEIAADLERAYRSNAFRGVFVEPFETVVLAPVRPALYTLLAAVAFVLLIACGNVANLLLVRMSERVREVTVRAALGAGAGRLSRQFFAEAAVLVFAGATVGLGLAYAGVKLLVAFAPASLPRIDLVGVDRRVLAATLSAAVLIALAFGLLPILHIRRLSFQQVLGSAGSRVSPGRSDRRLRSALVVGELAMATMLLVGGGLLIRTLWSLQQVDPGFSASGVLKAEFQLPPSRYPIDFRKWPNLPERLRFFSELSSRLAAAPGVESATIAGANPLDAGFTSSIVVIGREAEARDWPEPSVRIVSPTYFQTVRLQVIDGRTFDPADVATSPSGLVALINDAANRRFFGGKDAIGQRFRLWGAERRIVGIVGNERSKGLTEAAPPSVYMPIAQAPQASAILVRVPGDPMRAVTEVRRVVRDLDPQLPLFGIEPLTTTLGNSQAQRRFTMIVLVAFAAVALILAIIGVHGVLSYTVAQRTREIGIRVALGAGLSQIRELVLSQGAGLAAIGITTGLVGAFALSRLLTALLFGVGARDPLTFGGSGLVLAMVAMIACWLPARKAARVDPIDALRCD